MPVQDEKDSKPDLFKPQQPRIPGVATAPPKAPEKLVEPAPAIPKAPPVVAPHLVVGLVVLLVALVVGIVWLRHALAAKPSLPASSFEPGPAVEPEPAAPKSRLPRGPGPIATTEELAKPWSAKKFFFTDPVTGEAGPAMVVHIPGGYWAFSLVEPFGKCELNYVEDLATLRSQFNVVADHPMVVNPCNNSVFDLLRYGEAPKGLVRGEVVQGAAIRPPVAIEVRVEGREIIAVRGE